MRVGRYEIASVLDAHFAVDGGALFGTVPRVLWERKMPPDARNRVRIAARCLLAIDRDARRTILVGTGIGDRWDAKWMDIYAIDRAGGGLRAQLARHGVAPEDVTDVVLSHLHFDHAGGTVRQGAGGKLELAFPRATHHVHRRAWHLAYAPSVKDAASFRLEDFDLLRHSHHLHLVEGDAELFPDVEVVTAEGHSAGEQLPRFNGDGVHVTFCGNIIPTHAHLRPSWVSAYDLLPVTTVEEKKVLMAEALEENGVLVFEHDPEMAACRLREENGLPVFHEAVAL